MTLIEALGEFLLDQRARGNTAKTLESYRNNLSIYLAYAGGETPVESLTVRDLKAYAVDLRDRDLSSVSVQSYIRALRAFLGWCYREGYTSEDLTERFRLPKAQRKLIDVLTDQEVAALLACFDLCDTLQLRNYCMVSLMLGSGLRRHEVVTLSLDMLHLPDGYIVVDGKGQKQRMVPVGKRERDVLREYISRRPVSASRAVFLKADGQPVTDSLIEDMFADLKAAAGIPRLRAHLLRHTFATCYLEGGGNIISLQHILGHTSLEMVKRYLHLSARRSASSFPDLCPLDRFLGS